MRLLSVSGWPASPATPSDGAVLTTLSGKGCLCPSRRVAWGMNRAELRTAWVADEAIPKPYRTLLNGPGFEPITFSRLEAIRSDSALELFSTVRSSKTSIESTRADCVLKRASQNTTCTGYFDRYQ